MTLHSLDLALGYYSIPPGGRDAFPPATTQPMKSHHALNSQFMPIGPLVHNSLPNLLLFSSKKQTAPSLPTLAYGFASAFLSRIAVLSYSPINPSFAARIIGGFHF